jgi:hypothetical protein
MSLLEVVLLLVVIALPLVALGAVIWRIDRRRGRR